MRAFTCPRCRQLVFFDNDRCLRCGADLGFDPGASTTVLAPPTALATAGWRRCANYATAGCNWVVPTAGGDQLCPSCRLTRVRPSDADLEDRHVCELFVRTESAKRRLLFQLAELGLTVGARGGDGTGLAFDLLVRKAVPITIGHADGVITLDLAESDDAYRERMRAELGEPYRTMLGHLRHEVGHYYWNTLVQADEVTLARFRHAFGDEREDYQQALRRHYDNGPSRGWEQHHVSAYGAAHPWEDWAETWAHYLHIRDTLQTAAAYGVVVRGPRTGGDDEPDPTLGVVPSPWPQGDLDDILADWLPLTYALNAINASMGRDFLYPFVLSATVIAKLRFVHGCVLGASASGAR